MSESIQNLTGVIQSSEIKVKHFPERCDTRIDQFDFIVQWSEIEIKIPNSIEFKKVIMQDTNYDLLREYVEELTLTNIGYVLINSHKIRGQMVRKLVVNMLHAKQFVLKEQDEFNNEEIIKLASKFYNGLHGDYDEFRNKVLKLLSPRNIAKVLGLVMSANHSDGDHFRQWLKNENFRFQHEINMYKKYKTTVIPKEIFQNWGIQNYKQEWIHFSKNKLYDEDWPENQIYWNTFDDDYEGIEAHSLESFKKSVAVNTLDSDTDLFENAAVSAMAENFIQRKDYSYLINAIPKNTIENKQNVILSMSDEIIHSHFTSISSIKEDGTENPQIETVSTLNALYNFDCLIRVDIDTMEELCCMAYDKGYHNDFPLMVNAMSSRPLWKNRTRNETNRFWLSSDANIFIFCQTAENFLKGDQATLKRFVRGMEEPKQSYCYKSNNTFYKEVTPKHYLMGLITFLFLTTGINCKELDSVPYSNYSYLLVGLLMGFLAFLSTVFIVYFSRYKKKQTLSETSKEEKLLIDKQKKIFFPRHPIMYLLFIVFVIANVNALDTNITSCKSNILAISEVSDFSDDNNNIIFYGKARQYWSPFNNQCFKVDATSNNITESAEYYMEINDAHYELILKDQMLCGDPVVSWRAGSGCGLNRILADCPGSINGAEFFSKKSLMVQNKGCLIESMSTRACVSIGAATNWEYETYVVENVKPKVTISLYRNGEYLLTKTLNENSDNTIERDDLKLTISSFQDNLHKNLIGKMVARRLSQFNVLRVIENYNKPGYLDIEKFCWAQRQQNNVRVPFSKMVDQTVITPIDISKARVQAKFYGVSHSKIYFQSPTIEEYTGKDWHLYTLSEKLNNDLYYYSHSHVDNSVPNSLEYFNPELQYRTEPLTIMRTIDPTIGYTAPSTWLNNNIFGNINETMYIFFRHFETKTNIYGGDNLLNMEEASNSKMIILEFVKGYRILDPAGVIYYSTEQRELAKGYFSYSNNKSSFKIVTKDHKSGDLDPSRKYLIQGTLDELVLSNFAGRWRLDKENFSLPHINTDMSNEMSSEINIKVKGNIKDNNYSCKVNKFNIDYSQGCYDLDINVDSNNCLVSITTDSPYLTSTSKIINRNGAERLCMSQVQENHNFNITVCGTSNCIHKKTSYLDYILNPKSFYFDVINVAGTAFKFLTFPISLIGNKLTDIVPKGLQELIITWAYRLIMICILLIILIATLGVSYFTIFGLLRSLILNMFGNKRKSGKIKVY